MTFLHELWLRVWHYRADQRAKARRAKQRANGFCRVVR